MHKLYGKQLNTGKVNVGYSGDEYSAPAKNSISTTPHAAKTTIPFFSRTRYILNKTTFRPALTVQLNVQHIATYGTALKYNTGGRRGGDSRIILPTEYIK